MSNKFKRNSGSTTATKTLDLGISLTNPMASGDIIYSEEIIAGSWSTRGFNLLLETLDCSIELTIESSFTKNTPRIYSPVFNPILQQLMVFNISSTATDPGSVSFANEFAGDWIRFKIENTGSNVIDSLNLEALLSGNPDLGGT